MSLDPEVRQMIEETAKLGLPPVFSLPVVEGRQRMRNAFISKDEPLPVFKVENTTIPCPDHQIPLRIYYPGDRKDLPCLLFLHGGGWTINDLDTHDALCRSITNDVQCVVVSVDFRRAPEHKFPAAIDDSYAALEWVDRNHRKIGVDRQKIGIGGDSSGGNQAAVVAMLSRDRGGPAVLFQWLAYPVTEYHTPFNSSYEEMAVGYSLNKEFMIWFWNNYLPEDFDRSNPYLFPLQAQNFASLPPAFIMTANFDPLRDEGEAYGARLREAGVSVSIKRYESQMHGFLLIKGKIKMAEQAYQEAVIELKRLFVPKSPANA